MKLSEEWRNQEKHEVENCGLGQVVGIAFLQMIGNRMADRLDLQDELLGLYREYYKWLDDEYTQQSWATGKEIRDKIALLETKLKEG
jgi:hypothetical protein